MCCWARATTSAGCVNSSVSASKPIPAGRKAYGGMKVGQAKRLKALEAEHARLRRAVADLTVDKLLLKEVAAGRY